MITPPPRRQAKYLWVSYLERNNSQLINLTQHYNFWVQKVQEIQPPAPGKYSDHIGSP